MTLKKSLVSLHLIRESDIWRDAMTEMAPKVGGLVEFYRSPARKLWTPTGVNVPGISAHGASVVAERLEGDFRRGDAAAGHGRPGPRQDAIMERLEKSGVQGDRGPKMNEPKDPEYWYAQAAKDGNVAPQRKLANEKPQGVTVDYDELIKTWKAQAPAKKG